MNVSQTTARHFVEGDETAFGEVYSAYRKLLFFIIGSIVGNSSDAEDVFQEVFLSLWKNRHNIKKSENLHWYLITTAKNEALSFVRKRDALVDYSSLLDVYGKEEHNAFLDDLLKGLAPMEANVVIYKVEWGFSFEEIARLTGYTRQTIAKHYHEGMRKLRKQNQE